MMMHMICGLLGHWFEWYSQRSPASACGLHSELFVFVVYYLVSEEYLYFFMLNDIRIIFHV